MPYVALSSSRFGFSRIAPGFAGNTAPFGGLFFALNVSQISSILTHSTPSYLLIASITLEKESVYRHLNPQQIVRPRSANKTEKEKNNNIPFEHKQPMRMPTNIRMHRDRKHKPFLFLSIMITELIHPQLLYRLRIHPPMTIRRLFDEHHGR